VPDSPEEDPDAPVVQVPVPILQAPARSFRQEMAVGITCADPAAGIRYRIDGGNWVDHRTPVQIVASCIMEAQAYRSLSDGSEQTSFIATAAYTKLEEEYTITLESRYAPEYAAGGDEALIDGLRGGADFRTGGWQGYRGQDLVASIDLGRPRRLKRLGIGVLQDVRSWIWYPAEVEFAVSMNRRQWSSTIVLNNVARDVEGSMVQELWTDPLDRRARYIEVVVRSAGPCPEWHPGAGEPSWIFADEVLLELDR